MKFQASPLPAQATFQKEDFAVENSDWLTSLAALAAKLAATRHGGSAMGTLERHQRGATLLAESRTTTVRRLAVGAVNCPRDAARVFALATDGRRTVTTISRGATAMSPAMTIVIT